MIRQKPKRKQHWFILSALLISFSNFFIPEESEAVPAFARQTGYTCTTCHTAYPSLNKFGRRFRELGYRLTEAQDPEGPWDLKFLPFAIQANTGAIGEIGEAEHTKISIDALQFFAGGPVAKKPVFTYIITL